MVAQPIETLLVSANSKPFAKALDKFVYRIETVADPGKAMEMLRDNRYDLILLDDKVFSNDLLSIIREIKRRFPLVPVLILSENPDAAYQTDLMEAGADDSIVAGIKGDELQRRLRIILRQRRQAQMLAQRNQNLQSINLLARRMHSATEPLVLIEQTIETACATFQLYGMALVLTEGDTVQMFAGQENSLRDSTLTQENLTLELYDPFQRVIQSGFVQVFQNIVADPHYRPIPALPAPQSVIILPLNYQDQKLGAMGLFGTGRHPLDHEDLVVFELFASHFAVALVNARYYRSQRISSQSSQHLLRAWQQFMNLRTEEDLAENLRLLIEDMPNVKQSLVWMYSTQPPQGELIVKTGSPELAQAFTHLEQTGLVSSLIQRLDDQQMQPIVITPDAVPKEGFSTLFKGLRGQQLLVAPIMDSARFIGGIIASITSSRQFTPEDTKVMAASLTHAAGLAVERTTLIEDMAQKSGRLETLLRSTSQGIFFLDETGLIAFCNPQFTEITGINPSEVLGQSPETLLERVASQSDQRETNLEQLENALNRLLSSDPDLHEDYPIVELSLRDPARDIDVEFMLIGDANRGQYTWAGIVRDNARYKREYSSQTVLLDLMSERIRVPYAQVRGLLQTLNEQHSRFTHRERARFLHQVEESVDQLGRLWDNILEMYNLQVSGLALSREEVDLYEIIQRILDSRTFTDFRRHIQVEAPANLPLLQLDEIRIEQAITNVLYNAARYSPRGAPILIRLEHNTERILISIHDQGIGIPQEQLDHVFEPFFQGANNPNAEGAGLGLYLAREVIQRHGGSMWIESTPGKGTVVTLMLPSTLSGEVIKVVPAAPPQQIAHRAAEPAPVVERIPVAIGRRVSERPMQTIMVVAGRSKITTRLKALMGAEYEMIEYRTGEEALRDVNTVRLDLIFLDMNLTDANGLDICERMCKRTEVPIIVITDEVSEPEKVRAFMIGADDYIANPISDEELTARVNVIFKRRRIPDRTREPLDLGNLYVDFARREVFLNNKPLELTRIEYDLLNTLAVNQGQVLTHKQLLEKVWGPEYQGETQYLWVNVSRLRKKLEPTPDSTRYIHTQPGVGYVFRPS